jgi:hypothetical protein
VVRAHVCLLVRNHNVVAGWLFAGLLAHPMPPLWPHSYRQLGRLCVQQGQPHVCVLTRNPSCALSAVTSSARRSMRSGRRRARPGKWPTSPPSMSRR